MEYIVLDIGTSFTKGAIADVQSVRIRNVTRRPAAERLPTSSALHHEIDASTVVDSARELIAELLSETQSCCGILLTGQMGGLVLCNQHGHAVCPYISWLDQRATEPLTDNVTYFEALGRDIGSRASTVFGNEFRPGLPLSLLFRMQRTGELKTDRQLTPCTLPDYVAAALCGESPVMEWTATTGSLNINEGCLAFAEFEQLGLTNLIWPQVVDFRHRVGAFKNGSQSVPVYAAVGDHQCSLAGTLLRMGEMSLNISTGSQISMLTDTATTGDYQLRPYFDDLWLKTITNIPAGRSLTALMSFLTEMNDGPSAQAWQYFFQQAESTADSDMTVNLAFFPGAISGPGMISNLREDNLTVGHLARSSLEQMATYYQQLGSRIDPENVRSGLAFSGGIAQQSSLLRQLIATRLGSEFRVATTSEDALNGLLVLGRVVSGLNATVSESCEAVALHLNAQN